MNKDDFLANGLVGLAFFMFLGITLGFLGFNRGYWVNVVLTGSFIAGWCLSSRSRGKSPAG